MENPSFYLEGVVRERDELRDFDGPLSLILMLLTKNKIEIRDISISDILDQYLAYLERMQSMDLEVASEFVQMAAQLMYIKTRTLLNTQEETTELELLRQSLEQLKCRGILASVRERMPELKAASEQGMLYYAKLPEPLPKQSKEYVYSHKPVELLKAMYSIYSRGGRTPETEELIAAVPKPIVYSVRSKSEQILHRLKKGRTAMNELYADCRSRSEVVATFMSVLELCSLGSVTIEHTDEGYYVEFSGGELEDILEKIIE